jgi:hypothetical protein
VSTMNPTEVPVIDIMVDPKRWVRSARYRVASLERAVPPHTWRFVCRHPEGGVQLLAAVSFPKGKMRTTRMPLKSVVR